MLVYFFLAWLLHYGMPISFYFVCSFGSWDLKEISQIWSNHLPQIPKKPLMQTFFYPQAIASRSVCGVLSLSRSSLTLYVYTWRQEKRKRRAWTDFALWMDGGRVSLVSHTHTHTHGWMFRNCSCRQEVITLAGNTGVYGRNLILFDYWHFSGAGLRQTWAFFSFCICWFVSSRHCGLSRVAGLRVS